MVHFKKKDDSMSVQQAGKKGGERVSELIDKGKQTEE